MMRMTTPAHAPAARWHQKMTFLNCFNSKPPCNRFVGPAAIRIASHDPAAPGKCSGVGPGRKGMNSFVGATRKGSGCRGRPRRAPSLGERYSSPAGSTLCIIEERRELKGVEMVIGGGSTQNYTALLLF